MQRFVQITTTCSIRCLRWVTNDGSRLLCALMGISGVDIRYVCVCVCMSIVYAWLIHSVYIYSATAINSYETSNSSDQMRRTMIFPVDDECEDMSNEGTAHTTRYFVCLVARLLMLLNWFRRIGAHFVSDSALCIYAPQYVTKHYICMLYIYLQYTLVQLTALQYPIQLWFIFPLAMLDFCLICDYGFVYRFSTYMKCLEV